MAHSNPLSDELFDGPTNALRSALVELLRACRASGIQRSLAPRRLAACVDALDPKTVHIDILARISDSLDELFSRLPEDEPLMIESLEVLCERVHDELGYVWAYLLAGEEEAG